MLTDWPPGPGRSVDVDLEVVRVDLDVDLLGLGQHGHRRGGGVDAALRLGLRHALHAVRPALELEDAVRAVAAHLERVVAVGLRQRLGLEPEAVGVAQEHPVDVAREQAGLLAPGPAPHLDDHVLVVVRVALDHGQADLLLELGHAGLGHLEHLAHLGVLGVVEQLAGARRVVSGAPVFDRQLVSGLERAVVATNLRIALTVVDDVGIRHLLGQLAEAGLDLVNELLDHRVLKTRRMLGFLARRAVPGVEEVVGGTYRRSVDGRVRGVAPGRTDGPLASRVRPRPRPGAGRGAAGR